MTRYDDADADCTNCSRPVLLHELCEHDVDPACRRCCDTWHFDLVAQDKAYGEWLRIGFAS